MRSRTVRWRPGGELGGVNAGGEGGLVEDEYDTQEEEEANDFAHKESKIPKVPSGMI